MMFKIAQEILNYSPKIGFEDRVNIQFLRNEKKNSIRWSEKLESKEDERKKQGFANLSGAFSAFDTSQPNAPTFTAKVIIPFNFNVPQHRIELSHLYSFIFFILKRKK